MEEKVYLSLVPLGILWSYNCFGRSSGGLQGRAKQSRFSGTPSCFALPVLRPQNVSIPRLDIPKAGEREKARSSPAPWKRIRRDAENEEGVRSTKLVAARMLSEAEKVWAVVFTPPSVFSKGRGEGTALSRGVNNANCCSTFIIAKEADPSKDDL